MRRMSMKKGQVFKKAVSDSRLMLKKGCTPLRGEYVSLSKIRRMGASQGVEVDTALVCARLQVLRAARDDAAIGLRRELEHELYPSPGITGSIKGHRLMGRRVGMTASEVRELFDAVEVLSPVAFRTKGNGRFGVYHKFKAKRMKLAKQ